MAIILLTCIDTAEVNADITGAEMKLIRKPGKSRFLSDNGQLYSLFSLLAQTTTDVDFIVVVALRHITLEGLFSRSCCCSPL